MGCLTNGLSQSAIFVNHHHHHRCHHRNTNCKDHNEANCTKENEFLSNNIMQSELQVGLWVFHSLFSENFCNTSAHICIQPPINNNKVGQIGFFHASFIIFLSFRTLYLRQPHTYYHSLHQFSVNVPASHIRPFRSH